MRIRTALIFIVFVLGAPSVAHGALVVSEVAWMGTSVSTADEWVELYNTDQSTISLDGWTLEWGSVSSPKLVSLVGSVGPGGHYLLERTDDTTVPGVTADTIFSGAISNSGEVMVLKQNGVEKYRLDASGGWPAGDNTTKETMQLLATNWVTAPATPRAATVGSVLPPNVDEPDEDVAAPPQNSSSPVLVDGTGALSVLKLFVGKDRTGIVGAANFFDAVTTDGSNRNIDANVVWSFGDGTGERGKKVSHIYKFPGTYVVVANADSGVLSAQSRFVVKILPVAVVVSKAVSGPTGFVELENKSTSEVNVGGLRVVADGVIYTLPPYTIILAGQKILIPNSLTGMYTMQSVALELSDGTRVVPDAGTVTPPIETLIEEKKLKENEIVALQAQVATLSTTLARSRQVSVAHPAPPKVVTVPAVVSQSVATQSPSVIVIERKKRWWSTLPASIFSIFRN